MGQAEAFRAFTDAAKGSWGKQVLALARKMRGGRERQDILDGAYHRYAFHDEGLPRWFAEDERRHLQCAARHLRC